MKTCIFFLIIFSVSPLFAQTMVWKQTNVTGGDSYIYDLVASKNSVFAAIGSSTLQGVIKSTDNGKTWAKGDYGITMGDGVRLACDSGNTLYAILRNGVVRSANDGETWQFTSIPQKLQTYVRDIQTYSNRAVYVSGSGDSQYVYRSPDNGDTWEQVYRTHVNGRIEDFSVLKNGNIFLIEGGSYNPGIFFSTDNGNSWERAYEELPITFSSIEVTPSEEIYCFGGLLGGLYRSSTQRDPFQAFDVGLENVSYIQELLFSKNGRIYLGTNGEGVFYSDHGSPWKQINNGLYHFQVMSLAEAPDGSIICGTVGGIYRLEPTSDVADQDHDSPTRMTFSANPCSDKTILSYKLTASEHVKITVQDITGRIAQTLTNSFHSGGDYSITINTNNMCPGLYQCILKIGVNIISEKLLVIN